MKTTSTPALQFSGYPLKIAESSNEKNEPLQNTSAEKMSKLFVAAKTIPLPSASELWDEAWFANYE